jgi:short subunit dehydrogenase-like uncharacterized protein
MTTPSAAPSRWMLYGASGYTGRLIAEEAVRRGHRPVLAGRSPGKLQPLADALGLEVVVASLQDVRALTAALEGLPLVVHAAGPFIHTSEPMIQACLTAGAHYLDITGELPVFENTFRHDAEARARGITLMSGVGFDVVPTDCMARYVAEKVPGAHELELAFAGMTEASAGTAKSMLEHMPSGGSVRRGGTLQPWPTGRGARRQRFSNGREYTVMPIPWGDLVTAWHTTGIPNITTYAGVPDGAPVFARLFGPLAQRALKVESVRRWLHNRVDATVEGPTEELRRTARSYVWGLARAADGRQAQAWLDLPEGYLFTARATVRAVEEVLARRPSGSLTPAGAFGADFVLGIEGCRRLDSLG